MSQGDHRRDAANIFIWARSHVEEKVANIRQTKNRGYYENFKRALMQIEHITRRKLRNSRKKNCLKKGRKWIGLNSVSAR